jgi:hypothetical protein
MADQSAAATQIEVRSGSFRQHRRMLSRSPTGLVFSGPIAIVVLVAMAVGVWWSFDTTGDRLDRRRLATREFLSIETPSLAEQLAVQQQRVRALTGRYTDDPDTLVSSWDEQLGHTHSVVDFAARHKIAVSAHDDGFRIAVHVGPDGGPAYRVAVDTRTGSVTRWCDDAAGRCRDGTWPAAIEDRHLLTR